MGPRGLDSPVEDLFNNVDSRARYEAFRCAGGNLEGMRVMKQRGNAWSCMFFFARHAVDCKLPR